MTKELFFKNKEILRLIALLSLACLVVFYGFIENAKLYLFLDIGSDTLNIGYPHFVLLNHVFSTGELPAWSFSQGIGKNIYPDGLGEFFSYPLYLMDKDSIAYSIVWVEITKILIAGIVFYYYLLRIGIKNNLAIIGSLMFAFSSYMIVGGSWYQFSTEAIYGALILLSLELYLQQRKWILLVVSYFFVASFVPFYVYTYGLFATFYYLSRQYIARNDIKRSLLESIRLNLYFLLGIGLGSVFFISALDLYFQSPRLSGSGYFNRLISEPILSFGTESYYQTILSRFFSNDLLGNGSGFRGWGNYLEAPMLYIGIIPLLVFPQFLSFENRKFKLILFATLVSICILVFPFARRLFWLFVGDYFRTISLYFSLMLLIVTLHLLQEIMDKRLRLNKKNLSITFVILNGILVYLEIYANIELNILLIVGVVLSLYFILLINIEGKYESISKYVLSFVLIFEVVFSAYISVNARDAVDASTLAETYGLSSGTYKAIDFLKNHDKSFYRIYKTYSASPAIHVGLNDAKVFGYNGLDSYHQFNDKNYIKYLANVDMVDPEIEHQTRWLSFQGRVNQLNYMSVKYILSKSLDLEKYNFKKIVTFDDVAVYFNEKFIPIGRVVDKFILEKDFDLLDTVKKDLVLINAVVISDKINDKFFKENFEELDLKKILNEKSNVQTMNYLNFKLLEMDNNLIVGTVDSQKDALLLLALPSDSGWTVSVNGETVDVLTVDFGMIGIPLQKGRSEILMTYFPKYLIVGLLLSLASLIVVLYLVYRSNNMILRLSL